MATVRGSRRGHCLAFTAAVAAGVLASIFALYIFTSSAPSSAREITVSAVPAESGNVPSDPYGGSVLAPGESDGIIIEGNRPSVFDADHPAIGKLDGAILEAVQRAMSDASDQGVELFITAGWRSAALQDKLFQDAVAKYGSEDDAARWVATADTSMHVSGQAVDFGPMTSVDWLAGNGWRYGLCQVYANETWHFESRPDAVEHGCPELYADPTEDPRMRR